jgi:hypothetical protein
MRCCFANCGCDMDTRLRRWHVSTNMERKPPLSKTADGTNRFPANNFPILVWDSNFLLWATTHCFQGWSDDTCLTSWLISGIEQLLQLAINDYVFRILHTLFDSISWLALLWLWFWTLRFIQWAMVFTDLTLTLHQLHLWRIGAGLGCILMVVSAI